MFCSPSEFIQDSSFVKECQAITPCTAEGLTPSLSPSVASVGIKQGLSSLFSSVSESNQEKFYEEKERSKEEALLIQLRDRESEEYGFKIKLSIQNQQNLEEKTFLKPIDSVIEENDLNTLVFKNQHQKLRIQMLQKYNVILSLQTEEGFERKFWERQIEILEQKERTHFHKITEEKNQYTLNLEIENMKNYWIKFLGVKLPIHKIDEFFEERFELLNQSDKLNLITSLKDLKGLFYELSKQNMGSRIIQKLLGKAKKNQIDPVIMELKSQFKNMAIDRYGNYVIQKIFKVSSSEQRKRCLKSFENSLVQLLFTKAGTFAIQSILDCLDQQDLQKVVDIIRPSILQIAMNEFGTHFIQKLLKKIECPELAMFLLENIAILGVDKHGIVVEKTLIKTLSSNEYLRYNILASCQNNFEELAFSEYGHYLVEELFSFFNCYELQNLLQYLCSNVERLAKDQFSSSILKKSLETFGDYMSVPMIDVLVEDGLRSLMENNSGSFMIHRFLEITQNNGYVNKLTTELIKECENLHCYEKKQKWKRFFNLH